MARIKIEDIRKEVESKGWKCNSTTYKNLDTVMNFTCDEGHTVDATWKRLRARLFCPTCVTSLKARVHNVSATPRTDKKRVMGLDQATYTTGWSMYDGDELIGYGVYETNQRNHLERIVEMANWLQSMIVAWKPDVVGLEDIQYNPKSESESGNGITGNHSTFKLLGQLMGALAVTAMNMKVEVVEVNNRVWKSHSNVKGRTRVDQKRSTQLRVKELFNITATEDECDAICIGRYVSASSQSVVKEGIGDYYK